MICTPRYIALCGWPKSGKDEVAKLLDAKAGYKLIDDGVVLRHAVPGLFGCDPEDPFSQEGKSKTYPTVCGDKSVRWMLGELGNALEKHFHEDFMPFAAVRMAEERWQTGKSERFVFPSVRKRQGWFYRRQGGIIVRIDRPGVLPSEFEFDKWDESCVEYVLHNNGTLKDLEKGVDKLLNAISLYGGRNPGDPLHLHAR